METLLQIHAVTSILLKALVIGWSVARRLLRPARLEFVLAFSVELGTGIFSQPTWKITTQALTALVMLYFAVQLVRRLF